MPDMTALEIEMPLQDARWQSQAVDDPDQRLPVAVPVPAAPPVPALGDAVRFHFSEGHTPGLMLAEICGPAGDDARPRGGLTAADLAVRQRQGLAQGGEIAHPDLHRAISSASVRRSSLNTRPRQGAASLAIVTAELAGIFSEVTRKRLVS